MGRYEKHIARWGAAAGVIQQNEEGSRSATERGGCCRQGGACGELIHFEPLEAPDGVRLIGFVILCLVLIAFVVLVMLLLDFAFCPECRTGCGSGAEHPEGRGHPTGRKGGSRSKRKAWAFFP